MGFTCVTIRNVIFIEQCDILYGSKSVWVTLRSTVPGGLFITLKRNKGITTMNAEQERAMKLNEEINKPLVNKAECKWKRNM